jgi:hypothetical protein
VQDEEQSRRQKQRPWWVPSNTTIAAIAALITAIAALVSALHENGPV